MTPTELAYQKGKALLQSGISFSEFGTRRRRSRHTHDLVVSGLQRAADEEKGAGKGTFVGTSNVHMLIDLFVFYITIQKPQVYLAYKHGIRPSGTIAQ